METIVSGVERLLWFIYKIFFVQIPSVLFIIALYFFLDAEFPLTIDSINRFANENNTVFWIGIICSCFIMDKTVGAITTVFFSFDDIINLKFDAYGINVKTKSLINEELNRVKLIEGELDSRELVFLYRMNIFKTNPVLMNYYTIAFCNYKIIINFAFYLIITTFFVLPFIFFDSVTFNNKQFLIASLLLTLVFLKLTELIVEMYNIWKLRIENFMPNDAKKTTTSWVSVIEALLMWVMVVSYLYVIVSIIFRMNIFWVIFTISLLSCILLINHAFNQRLYALKIILAGYVGEKIEKVQENKIH